MYNVAITVKGGMVQGINADTDNINFVIVDMDNIYEDDPDGDPDQIGTETAAPLSELEMEQHLLDAVKNLFV